MLAPVRRPAPGEGTGVCSARVQGVRTAVQRRQGSENPAKRGRAIRKVPENKQQRVFALVYGVSVSSIATCSQA